MDKKIAEQLFEKLQTQYPPLTFETFLLHAHALGLGQQLEHKDAGRLTTTCLFLYLKQVGVESMLSGLGVTQAAMLKMLGEIKDSIGDLQSVDLTATLETTRESPEASINQRTEPGRPGPQIGDVLEFLFDDLYLRRQIKAITRHEDGSLGIDFRPEGRMENAPPGHSFEMNRLELVHEGQSFTELELTSYQLVPALTGGSYPKEYVLLQDQSGRPVIKEIIRKETHMDVCVDGSMILKGGLSFMGEEYVPEHNGQRLEPMSWHFYKMKQGDCEIGYLDPASHVEYIIEILKRPGVTATTSALSQTQLDMQNSLQGRIRIEEPDEDDRNRMAEAIDWKTPSLVKNFGKFFKRK